MLKLINLSSRRCRPRSALAHRREKLITKGRVFMPPAARITDMHQCTMFTGPVPHVGGPVAAPGCMTVLIGSMPAACVSDICVCAGPPDIILNGSATVIIGGRPAARMGDLTAHGGVIISGCPTVIIGG